MDVFNHSFSKLYIKTINDLDPGLNLPEIDSAGINLILTLTLTLTQTLTLGLSLGLGLAWGHFQNKYFFVYPSLKDFSLNV